MTGNIEPELAKALIAAPRNLQRERGWSGARSVGMVRIIERRLSGLIENGPNWEEPPMKDDASFSLKPLTTCIAVFNVSVENRVGVWSSGPLGAREYDAIIRMMEFDRETMRECEAGAAQVGTHPKGGDAKQAPGESLSDAVAEGDAP